MRFALTSAALFLLSPGFTEAALIPGTSSIWLAGQPDGTTIYQNTAPVNSPILIDLNALGHPAYLTFTVTGGTARGPDAIGFPLVGGDGETPGTGPNADQAWSMPPVNGLSGFTGPYSGLVGVFLSAGSPGSVPPSLVFGTPASRSFTSLSPELQQVFFIGDGRTGVGTGGVQTFFTPTNATRLYLATYDSISFDNVGSLQVDVLAPSPIPTPAPPTFALFSVIAVSLYLVLKRERQREFAAEAG